MHRGRIFTYVFLLLSIVLFASPTMANAENAPEAVVQAYFDYLAEGDWQGAGTLFDPDAIAQIKSLWMMMIAQSSPEDGAELLWMMFGPGTTMDDFESMDGATVFGAMMGLLANQGTELSFQSFEVLGGVTEGPDLMHFVTRTTTKVTWHDPNVPPVQLTQMEVVSLRKNPERWVVLLTGDLEAMVKSIEAALVR